MINGPRHFPVGESPARPEAAGLPLGAAPSGPSPRVQAPCVPSQAANHRVVLARVCSDLPVRAVWGLRVRGLGCPGAWVQTAAPPLALLGDLGGEGGREGR